jgi:hypothetical protein
MNVLSTAETKSKPFRRTAMLITPVNCRSLLLLRLSTTIFHFDKNENRIREGNMKFRYHWVVFLAVAVLFAGCATKTDFQRLENKVDLLIQATKRSTLDELFGEQSSQIAQLVNDLDSTQKQEFENLQQEYARGTTNIEVVRQKMLGVLGNNNRVVSTRRGIYVRNTEGDKIKAIPNDTKIVNCHLVVNASIPAAIQEKDVLNRFSWGQGELNGETILFPWELTISSFTKEVAEHTARRTAQEFIKMGGEKQWQRPIQIQISTEKDDKVKISTNEEENEVYFEYENLNQGKVNNMGTTVTTEEKSVPLTTDEGSGQQ